MSTPTIFFVPSASASLAALSETVIQNVTDITSLKISRTADEATIASNTSAISAVQGVNTTQNTSITAIQAVDATQTTNITANATALTALQTVVTTAAVVSTGSSLALGSNSSTINIGTGAILSTLNLGTGAGVTTINIGGAGDTVNLVGETNIINSTILTVTDPVIVLNAGGGVASGGNAGIKIKENGVVTGSILSRSDRTGYTLTPCNLASPSIGLNQSLLTTDDVSFNNVALNSMSISGNSAVGNLTVNGTLSCANNINFGGVRAVDLSLSNIAVSKNCGTNFSLGHHNVAVGQDALTSASATSSQISNVALGAFAMTANTTGYLNTACGTSALIGNTTGTNNVAVGYGSGSTNTTGNNNTMIGYAANPTSSGLTNATAIGYMAIASASNTMQLGDSNLALINTNANLTCSNIIAANTAITGTLSSTGVLSTAGTTFNINSQRQPVTVSGSFSSGASAATAQAIPIMFQAGATSCTIRVRFQVSNNNVHLYVAGIDGSTPVTGGQPCETSKIYNQAAVITKGSYLGYFVGDPNMGMSTIQVGKRGTSNVSFMEWNTVYTYASTGTAKLEGFQYLDTATLSGILIHASFATVAGTYSVTNYF